MAGVICKEGRVDTTNIIRKLFDDVIPEKASEIETQTKKYSAQFRLVGDIEGFNLDAGGFSAIQYTSKE
jgi:hypothetical protein